MTHEEIEELASRIAAVLKARGWVPSPVRPEPPRPAAGNLPDWAGAAQPLSDVAPGRGGAPRHRPAYDAIVASSRAAAAGRGPSPLPGAARTRATVSGSPTVTLAVSNRHIHITAGDLAALFGPGASLASERPITQPGQFASTQRVTVSGPAGKIEGVRIVGPTRSATQVELAASDCRRIGVNAPVRDSGAVGGSAGVTLEGPHGTVELTEGAIVAAPHLHVSADDAVRLGLQDGDRVSVGVAGSKTATLHSVLVRAGATHATELHIDTDEASALGVSDGSPVRLLGPSSAGDTPPVRPRLVTERDVSAFAARGEQLTQPADYIVTPAARDRAKALGIWVDGR